MTFQKYSVVGVSNKGTCTENIYLITMINQNIHNKKDTHNVESINADLRHYIPVLARKSRCFVLKIENLHSVVAVFVDAYNQFGLEKFKYRPKRKKGKLPFSGIDFI